MTHERKFFYCPDCGQLIEWKAWMSGGLKCDNCGNWIMVSGQKIYLESELQTENGE
jgi:DNA-directed RNA polymerase subunit M/transcription elongation factor TFIIS